jgi:hypothetical protein
VGDPGDLCVGGSTAGSVSRIDFCIGVRHLSAISGRTFVDFLEVAKHLVKLLEHPKK